MALPQPGETPEPDRESLTRAGARPMCILGLDVGGARIGVAVKPEGQEMVLPLTVVRARPEEAACQAIRALIAERRVRLVVVGLPLNADPSQAREVKRFTRQLRRGVSGVMWRFCDETLSSVAAAEIGRALGEGRRAAPDDDRAAAIILQGFLDGLPRE